MLSDLGQALTFKVSIIDRNLRLSPTNMQLLMQGNTSFTLSSIGTGGTFSPPAVINSSAVNKQVTNGYKVNHAAT